MFDHPEYIHLGMDEEDARHCQGRDLAVFRTKDLYFYDLNYLIDTVTDVGAKPWIWSCPLFRQTEGYQASVDPEQLFHPGTITVSERNTISTFHAGRITLTTIQKNPTRA